MKTSMLIGIVLILVAVLDVVLGLLVVAPRVKEESRPVLRAAFVLGSLVMLGLGVAFLIGLLPGVDG